MSVDPVDPVDPVDSAREILRGLADPDRLAATGYWAPGTVHGGDAGVALAFGRLHRIEPDGGWDRIAHRFITRAARRLTPDRLGILDGLAGTAFVLRFLGEGGRRYVGATASAESLLMVRTRQLLDALPSSPRTCRQYDALSGLTGLGAALLEIPAARSLLTDLLDRLARWTAAGFHAALDEPGDTLNLGLAHGVPGPLALFALAHRAGVDCEEWVAHDLATQVLANLVPTKHGPDLPAMVPRTSTEPTRIAWCYGNIGAARALQLAGDAFGVPEWTAGALAMVRSGLARLDEPSARLREPILCHGTAGVLQVVGRICADADRALDLAVERAGLLTRLLAEPVPDSPALLTGAAGIALALLSAAEPTEGTDWDRTLLIN